MSLAFASWVCELWRQCQPACADAAIVVTSNRSKVMFIKLTKTLQIFNFNNNNKLFLVHAVETCRQRRGIASFMINLGTRWRWLVYFAPCPLTPLKRTHVSVQTSNCTVPAVYFKFINSCSSNISTFVPETSTVFMSYIRLSVFISLGSCNHCNFGLLPFVYRLNILYQITVYAALRLYRPRPCFAVIFWFAIFFPPNAINVLISPSCKRVWDFNLPLFLVTCTSPSFLISNFCPFLLRSEALSLILATITYS